MPVPTTDIKPADIATTRHFWNAFGRAEPEVIALWIVRFCTDRGGWLPFRLPDLEKWMYQNGYKGIVDLFELPNRWLLLGADGHYHITPDFVARCHKASPKLEGAS